MKFNFIDGPEGTNNNRGRVSITVQNFFQSEGNVGYMEKQTFGPMMDQIKSKIPALFYKYSEAFLAMKEDMIVANMLDVKQHQINKSDYIFLKLRRGNQRIEAPIYLVGNMEKFLRDYADRKIKIDFTLAELIEEANKP